MKVKRPGNQPGYILGSDVRPIDMGPMRVSASLVTRAYMGGAQRRPYPLPCGDLRVMTILEIKTMTEATEKTERSSDPQGRNEAVVNGPWQPIETAPKGVTDVIDLWACGERYTDCIWMKPTYETEYCWCNEGGRDCDGPIDTPVPNPTHWMWPPKPPIEAH